MAANHTIKLIVLAVSVALAAGAGSAMAVIGFAADATTALAVGFASGVVGFAANLATLWSVLARPRLVPPTSQQTTPSVISTHDSPVQPVISRPMPEREERSLQFTIRWSARRK